MEFKNSKSIFQQIGDTICEKILNNEYPPEYKLPSVREMAAEIGVNPNTVMRSYSELQSSGIISNKRGIGFFVNDKSADIILENRKTEFYAQDLPEFLKQIELLHLNKKEIESITNQLKNLTKNETK